MKALCCVCFSPIDLGGDATTCSTCLNSGKETDMNCGVSNCPICAIVQAEQDIDHPCEGYANGCVCDDCFDRDEQQPPNAITIAPPIVTKKFTFTSLVGLSLSFCVQDIIRGKVSESDVDYIEAGTACETNADWEVMLTTYCECYWSSSPQQARDIVSRLRDAGKIQQPRLLDMPVTKITHGHWVVS